MCEVVALLLIKSKALKNTVMKTFEELQKLSQEEFDIEIAKIEAERKEYLKSEEYRQKLRDKGEEIMKILIKDNCNTAMNLGCAMSLNDDTNNPGYKKSCDEATFQRIKTDYQMGEGAKSAMKQANDLIQEIIKVYYK